MTFRHLTKQQQEVSQSQDTSNFRKPRCQQYLYICNFNLIYGYECVTYYTKILSNFKASYF
jgi:hypothetical protein